MKLGAGTYTVFTKDNEPAIWKVGQPVQADVTIHNRVSFMGKGDEIPFFNAQLPKKIHTYDGFQNWAYCLVKVLRAARIDELKERMMKVEEARQILFQKREKNRASMYSGDMSAEAWVASVTSVNAMITEAEGVYADLTKEYLQFDPPGFFLILIH